MFVPRSPCRQGLYFRGGTPENIGQHGASVSKAFDHKTVALGAVFWITAIPQARNRMASEAWAFGHLLFRTPKEDADLFEQDVQGVKAVCGEVTAGRT